MIEGPASENYKSVYHKLNRYTCSYIHLTLCKILMGVKHIASCILDMITIVLLVKIVYKSAQGYMNLGIGTGPGYDCHIGSSYL